MPIDTTIPLSFSNLLDRPRCGSRTSRSGGGGGCGGAGAGAGVLGTEGTQMDPEMSGVHGWIWLEHPLKKWVYPLVNIQKTMENHNF